MEGGGGAVKQCLSESAAVWAIIASMTRGPHLSPDPWSSAKVKCHPTVNDESVNLSKARDAK